MGEQTAFLDKHFEVYKIVLHILTKVDTVFTQVVAIFSEVLTEGASKLYGSHTVLFFELPSG